MTDKPAIEGLPVNELVAGLRVVLGQQPQGNMVVRRAALHQGQQLVAQLVIFGPLAGPAQSRVHQPPVFGFIQRHDLAKFGLERFHLDEGHQGLRQARQVPVGNHRLAVEGVAPRVVGVIADVTGIIFIEKGVGAEIEGDAQDRHVVGIHHSVTEAVGLPAGDHVHGALGHRPEHRQYRLRFMLTMRVAGLQGEIDQPAQIVLPVVVIEELEMAEADVRTGQPYQHGGPFLAFPVDRVVTHRHAQRPAAGNAQYRQRLGSEEFADRRAQHRAAVTHARKGRAARALEMQVPVLATGIDHFAQQQTTAIAELRVVHAELVAGIDHRPRLCLLPDLLSGKQLGEQRIFHLGGVEPEQPRGIGAADHQSRIVQRVGYHTAGENVAQTREAVIEMQIGQRGHGAPE